MVNNVKKRKIFQLSLCALIATFCVALSGCSVKDKVSEEMEKATNGVVDFANDLADKIMGVLEE